MARHQALLPLLLTVVAALAVATASASASAYGAEVARLSSWGDTADDDAANELGGGVRRMLDDAAPAPAPASAANATADYISYGALWAGVVPCSVPGLSYYNCYPGAEANPYERSCSTITQCRD